MHLFLIFSYAFSVWMGVDAYKRGVSSYWYLIIFLPLGEWVYFFMVKIHDFRFFSVANLFGPKVKCTRCKHRGKLDRDGVQCMVSGEPCFKTTVHIKWCTDYKER